MLLISVSLEHNFILQHLILIWEVQRDFRNIQRSMFSGFDFTKYDRWFPVFVGFVLSEPRHAGNGTSTEIFHQSLTKRFRGKKEDKTVCQTLSVVSKPL